MVRWLLALLVVGCGPSGFANLEMGPRKASFTERFELRTLPNGLRLVFLPDARTNLVTVGVNYAVGSGDDPYDEHGLAHYVEHIMFDASPRARHDQPVDQVALQQNAMTMFDRTYFYAAALDVHLLHVLEGAARRFEVTCDDFDDATLARERDVVIEELKFRAGSRALDALMHAMWGANHPYGHVGGSAFADVPRSKLCEFVAAHYGPASAVVVIAGNVKKADFDRITTRFAGIARRTPGKRVPAWTPRHDIARVTVPGLKRPEVMLVIPAPGEGSTEDAAIAMLDGFGFYMWSVQAAASISVVGEQRSRAIVVSASIDDARRLGDVERALRDRLASLRLPDIREHKEHLRASTAGSLDDLSHAAFEISAQVARGERPSRLHALADLDAVTEEQMKRLINPKYGRAIHVLPEIGVPAHRDVSALATSLHDVDLSRTQAPPLDGVTHTKLASTVQDYKLANGLRVLLAPDEDSVATDARLVISDAGGSRAFDTLPAQAAWRIATRTNENTREVRWYSTIAVSLRPRVQSDAVIFGLNGFHLFGDWHVWWLAWHVLHGRYWECEGPCKRGLEKRGPMTAEQLVSRRLARVPGVGEKVPVFAASKLESYRRAMYRPERSTLIVAGKFDVRAMRDEIEQLFGPWRGGDKAATPPLANLKSTYVALAAKDAATVEVALAFPMPSSTSGPSWVAREIIAEMLNDQLRVVREGQGASYGIHAVVHDGAIRITGHVEPAYVRDATKSIAAAIARVRDGAPELEEDFARARARVLAAALARPGGASARAAALERIALSGAATSVLDSEVTTLRGISFATVREQAARDLSAQVVIVSARGKADVARAALVELGADATRIETIELDAEGVPKPTHQRDRGHPVVTTSSAD
jgi:predicted Zn-dependent peptidase